MIFVGQSLRMRSHNHRLITREPHLIAERFLAILSQNLLNLRLLSELQLNIILIQREFISVFEIYKEFEIKCLNAVEEV